MITNTNSASTKYIAKME